MRIKLLALLPLMLWFFPALGQEWNPDSRDAQSKGDFCKAIRNGDINAAKLYLDRNTDVNWYDIDGYTPLMFAADLGDPEMVKLLMDHGAMANIKPLYGDDVPALHAAVKSNSPKAVDMLLLYPETDIALHDYLGHEALYYAVQYGYMECVEVLLYHGANVNMVDSSGATLMHLAAIKGDREMAQLLVENGFTNINNTVKGHTAFSLAVQRNNLPMAKMLRECGADASIDNPIRYAAMYGDADMIEYLHGTNPDMDLATAPTPIDLCLAGGNRRNVPIIRKYGGRSSQPLVVKNMLLGITDEFCKREHRLGASLGIHEERTNMSLYLGGSFRPQYKPALLQVTDNSYYQLRQKFSTVAFGLEKRFSINRRYPDWGPYLSYQYAFTVSKYDNSFSDLDIDDKPLHVPGVGIYGRLQWVSLSAGYRYYPLSNTMEAPKHVACISAQFYIPVSRNNYRRFGI